MIRRTVGAATLALAIGLIANAEGLRTTAYRDPVGIPTLCFGETRGVAMGDTATAGECRAMLTSRVDEFADDIARCLPAALPPPVHAAFLSLAYNIGPAAFCGSTLSYKARAGDLAGACAEISRWRYARGLELPGLARRRAEERALCESGLPPAGAAP